METLYRKKAAAPRTPAATPATFLTAAPVVGLEEVLEPVAEPVADPLIDPDMVAVPEAADAVTVLELFPWPMARVALATPGSTTAA